MFQTTRRRLALWYTTVTAILLLLFASGFYIYVRHTLVERIDDTLNHVVEIVQRSIVIEPTGSAIDRTTQPGFQVNLEASFPRQADAVEDDHIDLEWFSPEGELLWSTFSVPLDLPLHPSNGETVYGKIMQDSGFVPGSSALLPTFALRQITHQVMLDSQILGYLRVSHPWFEVTKPSRQLIRDLSLGTALMVGIVATIGWFLSGLAIAPVRDSYQRLKQFTADASHELRNPIAVIQTNVQVALADPDPVLQQNQLQVIERLTRRLGRLVDDLLFLARQDSGMIPLKRATVPLDKLIQEVIEEQQTIATDKIINLSLNPLESTGVTELENHNRSLYALQGDQDQLTRLFTNLIGNAVQYTPDAGRIEITLQRSKQPGNSQIQIQVKDTGVGIGAESLPHIFDRFYRVDPARTSSSVREGNPATPSANSGLGLAIAKVIVENHQGQIQVQSAPHQGTTFTVTLPCYLAELPKLAAS